MTNDPIRKGGPNDPVAQSIRNEQMRDAAPSPEEADRMHEDFLADEGCEVCDERDPGELAVVHPYHPPCGAYPTPPIQGGDFRVFCDAHRREPRELWWAKRVHGARKQGAVAVVEYACGATEYATRETLETDDPEIETWADLPPAHRPIPEVPVQCRCGEPIDDVHMLGGVE